MPPRNKGVDIENPLIIQAKEDLAERLDISPNQIALLSFEEVVWPDSSLGCPQPGMRYIQVPKDGAEVLGRNLEFSWEDDCPKPVVGVLYALTAG